MSDQDIRFRDVIRTARRAKDLTQEFVAAKLDVKQPAVSAWERGDGYPTPGNLLALARLLDLEVEQLLELMVAETADAVPA